MRGRSPVAIAAVGRVSQPSMGCSPGPIVWTTVVGPNSTSASHSRFWWLIARSPLPSRAATDTSPGSSGSDAMNATRPAAGDTDQDTTARSPETTDCHWPSSATQPSAPRPPSAQRTQIRSPSASSIQESAASPMPRPSSERTVSPSANGGASTNATSVAGRRRPSASTIRSRQPSPWALPWPWPSNATRDPSGDQSNATTGPLPSVSRCGGSPSCPPPEASTCHRSLTGDARPSRPRSDRNATERPSGDQAGRRSVAVPAVSARAAPPSAGSTQMALLVRPAPTGWPSRL